MADLTRLKHFSPDAFVECEMFSDRTISANFARDEQNNTFRGPYYKGVWLVQLLGQPYFYPAFSDFDFLALRGIMPSYEGTRKLILLPDSLGRLTERGVTPKGKRLEGYKSPMTSDDFIVYWNEEKNELDHLEINPNTLRPYPQLSQALEIIKKSVRVPISEWNTFSGPIEFGETSDTIGTWLSNSYLEINPLLSDSRLTDYDHEFGERIFIRGYYHGSPTYSLYNTLLNVPSSLVRFRIGRQNIEREIENLEESLKKLSSGERKIERIKLEISRLKGLQ